MFARLARGPTLIGVAFIIALLIGFASFGLFAAPTQEALPVVQMTGIHVQSVSPMTEISGVLPSLSLGSQTIWFMAIAGAMIAFALSMTGTRTNRRWFTSLMRRCRSLRVPPTASNTPAKRLVIEIHERDLQVIEETAERRGIGTYTLIREALRVGMWYERDVVPQGLQLFVGPRVGTVSEIEPTNS